MPVSRTFSSHPLLGPVWNNKHPCSTIAGGKVSQFDADSAGLNPAWRNAVVETLCLVTWEDGTSLMEIQGMISQLKGWIKAMYDITPNDGAYFNEVRPVRPTWSRVRLFTSPNRRPCLRSTGRRHFLARTIRLSKTSRTDMIRTGFSSLQRASDPRIGTKI